MNEREREAIAGLRGELVEAHTRLLRKYIHADETVLPIHNAAMDAVGLRIAALDALVVERDLLRQQLDSALAAIRNLNTPVAPCEALDDIEAHDREKGTRDDT